MVTSTVIDSCIVEFKAKYAVDQVLCDLVAQMVNVTESSRPTFISIKEKLAPNVQIVEAIKKKNDLVDVDGDGIFELADQNGEIAA